MRNPHGMCKNLLKFSYMDACITDILEKWEAPPINQVSKELKRLQKLMKQQETAYNELRYIT